MLGNQKPRIAIITIHPLNQGGVLTVIKVVYQFCSQFFEPTLFFPSFSPDNVQSLRSLFQKPTIQETEYYGMPAVEVGTRFPFWEPGHYAWTKSLWQEALKEYDYCFVVSGTIIAGHPAQLLKKKYVVWAATNYDDDRQERKKNFSWIHKIIDWLAHPFMIKIEKTILQKASAVGAMSSYTKRLFDEIVFKKDPETNYIGVPVTLKPFEEKELSAEKTIIAVGRFNDPRKNAKLLLDSFVQINSAFPETKLVIIGNKPEQSLINQYQSLSCFDQITFTGHVSNEELEQWYKKADLMIISSHQEGLGIIGLEAMSYGIPVVSTDCGGPRDFVYPNLNGFLVPCNDAQALKKAVVSVFSNPPLWKQMRTNAHEYVKNNASHKKIDELFKKLLCHAYPDLANHFIQEKLL